MCLDSTSANGKLGNELNLLSDETVDLFCKKEDEEAEKMIDNTFQFNRFRTKNGYSIVYFRLHYFI